MKTRVSKNLIVDFLAKRWVIVLIVALIVTTIIFAVDIYKEEVNPVDETVEYIDQDTIFLASENIDSFNVAISQSKDIYEISKLIYDSLFYYDENMQAVPSYLVKSYTVNTDRAGIEIELNEGIKFSDGSELTYQDVINSITTIRTAGTKSPYYSLVSRITQYYINYDGKLAVWFNNNYQCSLDNLTFPIFKSNSYGAYYLAYQTQAVPIGTGRYVYDYYEKDSEIHLIPNENYNGIKAEKNITFTIIPERELASKLLKIDTVTCYFDSSITRKSTALEMKANVSDYINNEVDFMVLNSSGWSVFSNEKFREAVVKAIDFNAILSDAYMNEGVLTDTLYYPNFYGVNESLINVDSDYDTAMSILEELDFKDVNLDRYIEDANGNEINVRILVNKGNSTRLAASKKIQKQLDKFGIRSEIFAYEESEYKRQLSIGNYDILITGYTFSEEYDLRFLFSGENPWYYYNYELLTYARNLDRMYTVSESQEYYKQLKEALLKANVYVPLCYKYASLIGTSTFTLGELPMWNNPYGTIDTWSWKKIKTVE